MADDVKTNTDPVPDNEAKDNPTNAAHTDIGYARLPFGFSFSAPRLSQNTKPTGE